MTEFKDVTAGSLGFVDWITAVIPVETVARHFGAKVPDLDLRDLAMYALKVRFGLQAIKGRWGYSNALCDPATGAVIQSNWLRPEMGVCVVYDGDSLQHVRWQNVIAHLTAVGARFTRIDATIDFTERSNVAEQLFNAARAQETLTKSKRFKIVKSDTGDTFYAGVRTSGQFLRVYDKGGQSGGETLIRWRAELECKGERADHAARAMMEEGTCAARRMIRGFFEAPTVPAFTMAVATAQDAITLPNDKRRTDTEAWLMGVVARTLAGAVERRVEFFDDFVSAMASYL